MFLPGLNPVHYREIFRDLSRVKKKDQGSLWLSQAGLPGIIKLPGLEEQVAKVVIHHVPVMVVTLKIIDDKAECDQQVSIGMAVGGNFIIVPGKPADGLFIPPAHLDIVPENRIFSSAVAIQFVHITPATALVLVFPE